MTKFSEFLTEAVIMWNAQLNSKGQIKQIKIKFLITFDYYWPIFLYLLYLRPNEEPSRIAATKPDAAIGQKLVQSAKAQNTGSG